MHTNAVSVHQTPLLPGMHHTHPTCWFSTSGRASNDTETDLTVYRYLTMLEVWSLRVQILKVVYS